MLVAPSDRCGSKKLEFASVTPFPTTWFAAVCMIAFPRTYSGKPRASSYVQNTPSTTYARPCPTS